VRCSYLSFRPEGHSLSFHVFFVLRVFYNFFLSERNLLSSRGFSLMEVLISSPPSLVEYPRSVCAPHETSRGGPTLSPPNSSASASDGAKINSAPPLKRSDERSNPYSGPAIFGGTLSSEPFFTFLPPFP